MKIKITTDKFELDAECQKRMNTNAKYQYSASVCGLHSEIKGCPMGRSFYSADAAIGDLVRRIQMESRIDVEIQY